MSKEDTKRHFAEICESIWSKIEHQERLEKATAEKMRQIVANMAMIAWNMCLIHKSADETKKALRRLAEEKYDGSPCALTPLMDTAELKWLDYRDDHELISKVEVKTVDGKPKAVAYLKGECPEVSSKFAEFQAFLNSPEIQERLRHTSPDKLEEEIGKIAAEYNGKIKCYVLPDGVGGRFSELCPVGLLPAAVLGIDIKGLLAGAAYMDSICRSSSIAKNPALACAVLQVAAMNDGKNVGVMMPYSDNLKYLADWYCQLWAESLGKNVTLDGMPCNVGQTPVKSLGVTDQHSQVQLYTEGPYDKVVTFLSLKKYACEFPIPHGCEDIPDVAFLGGHTMEELIQAENAATAYALTKAGRMNYTLYIPELNAFTLGELLFLFELQTAYAGAMFNIDTFNQPGVEEGKKATFALLGKAGYAEKKKELDSLPEKKTEYIV